MVSNIKGSLTREILTAELLRERLADTNLPRDPLAAALPPGSEVWPAELQKVLSGPLKPAGVLIPIVERAEALSVLLTQRSADLKHHAGQVSFPGGRMESHDKDVSHAALRETHEEVGIEPHQVNVIGYMESMATITGYAVTPVVGLVTESVELVIDRTEVEYAFEVPLEFLLDESNDRLVDHNYGGRSVPFVEFHYGGERIWGATAHMLLNFRKYLLKQ